MLLPMLRRLLIAVAVSLVVAPSAFATPVAEIIDQNGRVIAAAGTGRFDYPADGSLLHIGSASVTAAGVELGDVALLGGRIQAVRVVVPRRAKSAQVEGLFVDGHALRARVNRLIPLSSADYLITSQAAVGSGRRIGLVGLRLSFGRAALGLPAGAQILVGLPATGHSARSKKKLANRTTSPLAVLGFTGGGSLATLAALPPTAFFPTGTIGQKAVSIAERYLGIPYVWAGADPTGFDCSGLVMYVYAQLGIQLTHYTGSQIHQGTPVPRGALLAGDIVFFYPEGGVPGHEGMYVGNGMFIHAPHTGDVVKISSLDDPTYALAYVGAVRPYQ
jgi:cell wall-associated NlpC family hydrolase